jgi:hypothetical protein
MPVLKPVISTVSYICVSIRPDTVQEDELENTLEIWLKKQQNVTERKKKTDNTSYQADAKPRSFQRLDSKREVKGTMKSYAMFWYHIILLVVKRTLVKSKRMLK